MDFGWKQKKQFAVFALNHQGKSVASVGKWWTYLYNMHINTEKHTKGQAKEASERFSHSPVPSRYWQKNKYFKAAKAQSVAAAFLCC